MSNAQSLCASGPQPAERARAAASTEGASTEVAVGLRRTEASATDAQERPHERRALTLTLTPTHSP